MYYDNLLVIKVMHPFWIIKIIYASMLINILVSKYYQTCLMYLKQ